VAIARNEGRVFQSEFKVKSGLDRDIEVLARDGVLPDAVNAPQQRPVAPPRPPQRP
jgi:hypothetical protein